jgi:hypothetical protein
MTALTITCALCSVVMPLGAEHDLVSYELGYILPCCLTCLNKTTGLNHKARAVAI